MEEIAICLFKRHARTCLKIERSPGVSEAKWRRIQCLMCSPRRSARRSIAVVTAEKRVMIDGPGQEVHGVMRKSNKYSPEVRERAVRLELEHQGKHASRWAAIESIMAKIGCTAQTLRNFVRQGERDHRLRGGIMVPSFRLLR